MSRNPDGSWPGFNSLLGPTPAEVRDRLRDPLELYFAEVAMKHHGEPFPELAADEYEGDFDNFGPDDLPLHTMNPTARGPRAQNHERGGAMQSVEKPRQKFNVTRGKVTRPWRGLLFGVEGVGKSTFAAATPNPVFIGAEDGTDHLDIARFDAPENWEDIKEQTIEVASGRTEFKTMVLDTADWAEAMLWKYICARDKEKNIESYGYGKGYTAAVDEWRVWLGLAEKARSNGINVLLLAHSQVKSFKNPEGEDFDRYELSMHVKSAGLLKQWCDFVFFANHETFTKKDEKTKRVKGISTGARMIFTTKTAAYDAKNRSNLPEVMPLSWPDVEAAMASAVVNKQSLLEEITRKGGELGRAAEVAAAVVRAADDSTKLAQLNTWLNTQLAIAAQAAGKQA